MKVRKAVLKIGYGYSFYGDIKEVMEAADAIEKLTSVSFVYDDEGSYWNHAEGASITLEFAQHPCKDVATDE